MGIEALYRRLTDPSRLRRLPSTWKRTLGYSLAGIIVLIVELPLVPAHAEQLSASGDPSATVSQALKKIPHGSVVLAYPYPDSPVIPVPFTYKYESIDDALLDQAMTGLNFKLVGGYGWRPFVPAGYELSGTTGTFRTETTFHTSPLRFVVLRQFNAASTDRLVAHRSHFRPESLHAQLPCPGGRGAATSARTRKMWWVTSMPPSAHRPFPVARPSGMAFRGVSPSLRHRDNSQLPGVVPQQVPVSSGAG